ncbi:MAG TPA: hypothetical protein VGB07_18450 [Blastocatellia bacterium]
MNKQIFFRIAMPALFLFLISIPASAQSLENLMTVQVPFSFQVNEKQLPAGKYVIKRDPQTPQFLQIHCPEQHVSVLVFTMPLNLPKEAARTSLTFKEYGENRFLSEVRVRGRGVGYGLTRSKAELRLARNTKANTNRAFPDSAPKKD